MTPTEGSNPQVDPVPGQAPSSGWLKARFLLRWRHLLSFLILLPAFVTAGLILASYSDARRQLQERVNAENRVNMASRQDHVQELFGAVYSTILFISLDKRIQEFNTEAFEQIRRVIDYQYNSHRLSEVYVLERDFDGSSRPFMAFEHETGEASLEEEHSPEREAEEYSAQMIQIQRFAEQPTIPALISPEIQLCIDDSEGEAARGFVYSVPIRLDKELKGAVAGMIPTEMVRAALDKGRYANQVLLVNSWGETITTGGFPESLRERLEGEFQRLGVEGFLSENDEGFQLGSWVGLTTKVNLVADQKWWLVLLYDPSSVLSAESFFGLTGHGSLAASVVMGGLVLVLLVRLMIRRLAESLDYLRQRQQFEKDLQDAGEREQRRIGEILHEDLCQRLAGLELTSQALAKQLEESGPAQHDLANEIAYQARETLGRTRYLAGELHPLSMTLHGFPAAVEELAAGFSRRPGVRCSVEDTGLPKIADVSVATHVYRIVQEILSGFLNGSDAEQAVIRLGGDQGRGWISVTSDGSRLNENRDKGQGMGLRIVRYRSELIGGEIRTETLQGGGSRVFVSFPV